MTVVVDLLYSGYESEDLTNDELPDSRLRQIAVAGSQTVIDSTGGDISDDLYSEINSRDTEHLLKPRSRAKLRCATTANSKSLPYCIIRWLVWRSGCGVRRKVKLRWAQLVLGLLIDCWQVCHPCMYPGLLSLAIPLWVGAMSTGVWLCGIIWDGEVSTKPTHAHHVVQLNLRNSMNPGRFCV